MCGRFVTFNRMWCAFVYFLVDLVHDSTCSMSSQSKVDTSIDPLIRADNQPRRDSKLCEGDPVLKWIQWQVDAKQQAAREQFFCLYRVCTISP